MSEPAKPAPTSAPIEGSEWGARAADWAELCARAATPAWDAVADATAVGAGTPVLDVGVWQRRVLPAGRPDAARP